MSLGGSVWYLVPLTLHGGIRFCLGEDPEHNLHRTVQKSVIQQ